MGSKVLVFLVLFVAIGLLISSEVTARELAETTSSAAATEETVATEVGDQYGRGRGHYGGGGGHYGGGGGHYGGGRGGGHYGGGHRHCGPHGC